MKFTRDQALQLAEQAGFASDDAACMAHDINRLCTLAADMALEVAPSHPAQPTPDPWREALQEECDLLHITMPADAREAVKAVVAANVRIALNPDVSREAQALIDQGKAQASNPVA